MMKDQLAEIAKQVSQFLSEDSFTDQLLPECLRRAVLAYPQRGGKMLRPALVMWSCSVFDDDCARALPIAVAVELFHTWTLVHDDIIDGDDRRRGGPSVHRLVRDLVSPHPQASEFGIHQAILAGDVQQAWCNQLILTADEISSDIRLALAQRVNGMVTPLLISGEAMDVEFELRPFAGISPDEMENMLRWKTALLLRFAAESGAMIGLKSADPSHAHVSALGDFAESAGLAFQLRDDVLGMFGDEEKLGKPVGSDLKAGKRTYLFAKGLELMAAGDHDRLHRMLGVPGLGAEDISTAATMLRDCGALDAVETMIRDYHQAAMTKLQTLPPGTHRDLLASWADFAANRDY